jgi:hypothetical protein
MLEPVESWNGIGDPDGPSASPRLHEYLRLSEGGSCSIGHKVAIGRHRGVAFPFGAAYEHAGFTELKR